MRKNACISTLAAQMKDVPLIYQPIVAVNCADDVLFSLPPPECRLKTPHSSSP